MKLKAAIIGLLFILWASAAHATTITATATIDASAPFTSTVKLGVLSHTIAVGAVPNQTVRNFTTMLPAGVRDGCSNCQTTPTSFPTAVAAGSTALIDVLSDSWGYTNSTPAWFGNGTPPSNFAAYGAFVATIATNNAGYSGVIYDVLNEPNTSIWTGGGYNLTQTDAFNTIKQAFTSIRAVSPSAKFEGPSTSNYDNTYMTAFLDYCLANGIDIYALSYHDLQSGFGAHIDTEVSGNVASAIALAGQAKYAGIWTSGSPIIHVNEYLGQNDRVRPAEMLTYIVYMEGAALGLKSCWNETDGSSACNNGSIDSLVNVTWGTARPVWWVERLMAGMTHRIGVTLTSNPSNNEVVAAADLPDGNKGVSALVCSFNNASNADLSAITNVTLTFNGISSSSLGALGTLDVQLYSIPAELGESPDAYLTLLSESTASVSGNSTSVVINGITLHSCVLARFQDPGAMTALVGTVAWPL